MTLIKKKAITIGIIAALAIIALMVTGCDGDLSGSMGAQVATGLGDNITAIKIGDEDAFEVGSIEEALKQADAQENRDKEVTVFFGEDYKGAKSINPSERAGRLTYNLQGHTISRGNTDFVNSGEMFSLNHAGDITVCNGTISGIRTNNNGGAVWVDCDDVNLIIDGMTITGNETKQYGGGIFTDGCNATVRITSSTIKSNKASKYGGGLYAAYNRGKQAQFVFQYATVITGNNGTDENDDAVFARDGDKYTPADISGLTKRAKISFAFSTHDVGKFNIILEGENGSISADKACNYLVSNNTHMNIENKNGKLSFVPNDKCIATVKDNRGTFFYSSFEDSWKHAVMKNDCDVTLTLYQDWTASDGWFGNDGTDGFKNGQFYPLKRTTWLTFDLNGHTLDAGLTNARKNGRIFYFDEDCNMIIKNGTLTGANCSGNGGCIYIDEKDLDLHLEKVTITGNRCEDFGSAIYHNGYKYCKVTLKDTSIVKNVNYGTSDPRGAILARGTYYLSGKVVVKDNTGSKRNYGNYSLYYNNWVMYDEGIKLVGCENLEDGSRICISYDVDNSNTCSFARNVPSEEIERVASYFEASPGSKTIVKFSTEGTYANQIYLQKEK